MATSKRWLILFSVMVGGPAATAQEPAAKTPVQERRLRGHTGPVHRLRFTPDGKRLLSVSGWPGTDYTLRVWDLATSQEIRRIAAPGTIGTFTLSADGRFALVGSRGGIMHVDVESGEVLRLLKGHRDSIQGVVFAADGTHAFSASHDRTARQWDLASGMEVRQFQVWGKWARGLAELSNGRILTVDVDGVLQVWDVASGDELNKIATGPGWFSAMTLLPDGTQVLVGRGSEVVLWDVTDGSRLRAFRAHTDDVQEITRSPDGTQLLTASFDGTVRLWDFATGEMQRTLCTQDEWFFAATFSPDGRLVAAGGGGRKDGTNYLPGREHEIRVLDVSQFVGANAPPSNPGATHPRRSTWALLGLAIFACLVLGVLFTRRRRLTGLACPVTTPAQRCS